MVHFLIIFIFYTKMITNWNKLLTLCCCMLHVIYLILFCIYIYFSNDACSYFSIFSCCCYLSSLDQATTTTNASPPTFPSILPLYTKKKRSKLIDSSMSDFHTYFFFRIRALVISQCTCETMLSMDFRWMAIRFVDP